MFSGVPRFRILLGPMMSISRLGLRVLHTHMMLLRSKLQFVASTTALSPSISYFLIFHVCVMKLMFGFNLSQSEPLFAALIY